MITPVQYQSYHGGEIALPQGCAYGYYLAGNGAFKYGENRHLRALLPLAQFHVAGLPRLTPFVHLREGRLPSTVVHAIFKDARAQARERPLEVMYHVRRTAERISVEIPEQDGGASTLRYKGGDDPAIVLDMHSHCQMPAFFSSTDNRDEQGFRLYGVIGEIFTNPTARFRIGLYGDFWALPLGALFSGAGSGE
jgi:PRTRC genetic system protein A